MTTNDDDWVPTEEEVRHYTRTWFTESDMDRFLASVRREAKAEGWEQGYGDCWNYHQSNGLAGTCRNPYRAAEQETGHDDER